MDKNGTSKFGYKSENNFEYYLQEEIKKLKDNKKKNESEDK